MRMIHTTCLWCVWHQRWPIPVRSPWGCIATIDVCLVAANKASPILDMPRYLDVCRRNQQMSPIQFWGVPGIKNAKAMYLCIISSIIYYLLLWTAAYETDSWLARMVWKKKQRHTPPENSVRWFTWKCPASRSCGYHPSPLSRTLDFGLQHTKLTLSKMWTWWILEILTILRNFHI